MFNMVNSDEFAKRIEQILSYYDLSASSFAERINVGRASISHILSGRNKPSLDFVMKIVKEFPEVELYWLINGKGYFPKNSSPKDQISQIDTSEKQIQSDPSTQLNIDKKSSEIKKIIVFYKDGRFEVFDEQI